MSSSQVRVRWLGSAAVVTFMIGCSSPVVEVPAEPCPRPVGVFDGEVELVGGTCEPDYAPRSIKFEADDPNSTARTETRGGDTLVTETLLRGCELELKQSLLTPDDNRKLEVLEGTLFVESESEMFGTIELTKYEADGSTPRCSATYDVLYTAKSLIVEDAAD